MAAIETREERFKTADAGQVAKAFPASTGDLTLPTAAIAVGVQATARVNWGRWIADCPDPDCNGAELVSFVSPLFFCCECRNARWGHDLLPVVVPAPKKRHDVEAYLRSRPVPATRNWLPHESVADLRDENRARGILLVKDET